MNGEHVTIGWEEARAANLANWEDRVALHEESYELGRYDEPGALSDVVADDLRVLEPLLPDGRIAGKDVVHLQCHIGTDTVSLARAGARVTGVDFSPQALAAAERLAVRAGVEAAWVVSDVLCAAAAVAREFDVVYTSIGAICWLGDLAAWGRQVAALLRPGGLFYIRDGHPMLYTLDEDRDELVVRYRYFSDGTAQTWDEAGTYAGDGTVAHTRTYEWPHPLSEIVSALLAAGLELVLLDEGRMLPWRFSQRMVEVPGGFAWPGEERMLVPCTFTIAARRRA